MTEPTIPADPMPAPRTERERDYDRRTLAQLAQQLLDHETDYDTRYDLVIQAMAVARWCGYATGIRIDPAEPDWPVVYIELPTGQVSWHMPQHAKAWDGHTDQDRRDRLAALASLTDATPTTGA